MSQPIFRFAPSPNGYLHLGHAYAALYNQKLCKAHNGTMLLRMENTDMGRCNAAYETAIIEDLEWIGFEWQGEVRRQSDHFEHYAAVLDDLESEGLTYPAFLSRRQFRHEIERTQEKTGSDWPCDPDGSPHYPVFERDYDEQTRERLMKEYPNFAYRLNINRATQWLARRGLIPLNWRELTCDDDGIFNKIRPVTCEIERWGDIVLGRRDIPASYHLACVVDDAAQGVTHIVRGSDILPATTLHRVLQELLGVFEPVYCHHALITDDDGVKYSKRRGDTSLRALRSAGLQPEDIYKMIGLDARTS